MDRTAARPLVIVAAFAGSLVIGLLVMLWALGGARSIATPAAIGGPFHLTDQTGQTADLLRLHPLSGCLPDLAVRDVGGASRHGAGRRPR